jgi:hypothetical protein
MPTDIVVESISDYRMAELNHLKAWIYRQRIKYRKDKSRTERRQIREEAKAVQETKQLGLFKF